MHGSGEEGWGTETAKKPKEVSAVPPASVKGRIELERRLIWAGLSTTTSLSSIDLTWGS